VAVSNTLQEILDNVDVTAIEAEFVRRSDIRKKTCLAILCEKKLIVIVTVCDSIVLNV